MISKAAFLRTLNCGRSQFLSEPSDPQNDHFLDQTNVATLADRKNITPNGPFGHANSRIVYVG
ncbi:uncharacterized protein METZ01_LOCUS301011 [marine metagenome]|uniref:Uncharacterized protein n=1 Tax=marine metagenome TaxID=408172 RepID=A0A382MK73_9ZZZZ